MVKVAQHAGTASAKLVENIALKKKLILCDTAAVDVKEPKISEKLYAKILLIKNLANLQLFKILAKVMRVVMLYGYVDVSVEIHAM